MAVKQRPTGGSKVPHKPEDDHIYESPEALRSNLETFAERNSKALIGAGVVIALVIAGVFFYAYWQNNRETRAQESMFSAQFHWEKDSLNYALNGDGVNPGFLEIAEDFGGTKAANLANYYAGDIFLKQGEYDQAIEYLSDFSSDDILVQARAYALIGKAYMEKEQYGEAADHFEKAANHRANKSFTPQYLAQAALAHELAGDNEAALGIYTRITENYNGSGEFENARKQQARLEAMTGKAE